MSNIDREMLKAHIFDRCEDLECQMLSRDEIMQVIEEAPEDPGIGECWIPCSVQLPESSDNVLVTCQWAPQGQNVAIASYRPDMGGYWNIKTPVIAWMPLPEPYQDGN